jgi:peptidoglycan/xylan/chitin deacetylase (PgdA/CDA1 family)
MNTTLQTQVKATSTSSFTPLPGGLLQRKCACSGTPGPTGECEACRKKREAATLQPAASHAAVINTVPPIVHNVLSSPGQPLDPATRAFMEPRFGHDFSGIPTYTPAAGAIQTKLAINQPGDEYEQEADRVAEQVLAAPALPFVSGAPPRIQRFTGQASGQTDTGPTSVDRVLASPGRPLNPVLQQEMGQRFGYDFSRVRVHSGSDAEQSALEVNARAYTAGQNIVFGAGQHALGTTEGQRLLAHELTHVIQQNGGQLAGRSAARSTEPTIMRKWEGPVPERSEIAKEAPGASANAAKNVVYSLTFDDGPHVEQLGTGENRTEKVLDTLASKGAKAGFFIQSGARGANPIGRALVTRMAQDGHTVGIHTGGSKDHEEHPSAQKAGRLKAELESGKKYISNQTESEPKFVRPPYGKHDADVDLTYKQTNLTMLKWDIDGDKNCGTLDDLKNRFEREMWWPSLWDWEGNTPVAPKIVILYHDIRKNTAYHIGEMIDHIKNYAKKHGKTAKFEAP